MLRLPAHPIPVVTWATSSPPDATVTAALTTPPTRRNHPSCRVRRATTGVNNPARRAATSARRVSRKKPRSSPSPVHAGAAAVNAGERRVLRAHLGLPSDQPGVAVERRGAVGVTEALVVAVSLEKVGVDRDARIGVAEAQHAAASQDRRARADEQERDDDGLEVADRPVDRGKRVTSPGDGLHGENLSIVDVIGIGVGRRRRRRLPAAGRPEHRAEARPRHRRGQQGRRTSRGVRWASTPARAHHRARGTRGLGRGAAESNVGEAWVSPCAGSCTTDAPRGRRGVRR